MMDFGRVGGQPPGLCIGRPHAEPLRDLVGRAIEQNGVVGHVEVAVIIDPLLLNIEDS